MPLTGGASDKYGNRFEGKWTVYCLAQVMAEEADGIRLEQPGDEGKGCEFAITRGQKTEYHQVKRQHASQGGWSIPELRRNGILTTAFNKTRLPNVEFIFISTVSANLLSELSDAARKAKTPDEFIAHFLSEKKKEAWDQLLREWHPLIQGECLASAAGMSEQRDAAEQAIAYEHLARIRIRTLDEDSLTEMIATKLQTLIRSDPDVVCEGLASFALENVHKFVCVDELWAWAETREYRRVDYAKDRSILAAIEALNQRYESMIKPIGGDISIAREEVDVVLDLLQGKGVKRSALISGEAGVGKSVILGQVIKKIHECGIPYLYFRVDRLDPTDLPQNVGEQLGLPGSPVEILASVAASRLSVLIIDQLDAVSLASGRNPEFYGCIHEVIRQAEVFPNMRILLACRRFDLDKDNRLRELISQSGPAQEVKADRFTVKDVKVVLSKLGYESEGLSERQIELLRLPLHLSLLAHKSKYTTDHPFTFDSALDLFNAYWEQKRQAVARRTEGYPDQWVQVLDRLCEEMTEKQVLFVHEATVLDDFDRTVRAMESEYVLVLDQKRIGFFHEGFFDYVFARRFIANRRDLIEYLKAEGQHLFKRAPLRQILLYEHAVDPIACISNLRRVLHAPDIRLHLKKCALDAAGRIDEASDELWCLLHEILTGGDVPLVHAAWTVLMVGYSWFQFLNTRSMMSQWLASDDTETRGCALKIISNRIHDCPEKCVTLLRPYIGKSAEWNRLVLHIIWRRALSSRREVFNLFVEMVEKGAVDDHGHQGFWSCIYDLSKKHPEWAAEAIGIYLRCVFNKVKTEDIQKHFLERDGTGERIVPEVAERAPSAFLDAVLPFFLQMVVATAKERDEKLCLDPVWGFRMYYEEPLYLEDALLLGLQTALRVLAANSPDEFKHQFKRLREYGDYDSVNFLLVRSFSVAPAEFCDSSIRHVIEVPQRLEAGWAAGGGGDYEYWAAHELVEHCSKYCSDETFGRLQDTMLAYFPKWERSKNGYRRRGYWQFVMLSALDPNRRSAAVEARIAEWERKFQGRKIAPPVPSKAYTVGSPIGENAIQKMSDEQWLLAIAKYNTENGRSHDPNYFLKGGAHQLSGELEAATKREPERFARLVRSIPEDSHPYYFHAVLRGLKEAAIPKELIFEVIQTIYELPTMPGGRYLCDPIGRFCDEDIPSNILEIIGCLATEAEDPETSEVTIHRVNGTEEDRPHDILTTAINSVRGTAAETIGHLIFNRADRVSFFKPYLQRMVHDPTIIVRTTVAYALLALYRHEEITAVDLFLQLADIDDDELLATHHIDRFMYYANIRHFSRLRPILRRMLDSNLSTVREAGARHVCLAQFHNASANNYVQECLTGDDAKRIGAVRVAAANVFHTECRDFSHPVLARFFNDPVKAIRDEAASCFRRAEGRQLESCRKLIRSFLDSQALIENMEDLIWPLQRSTADIDEDIVEICEALAFEFERNEKALSNRAFVEVDKVCELVLRAYRNSGDERYRTRCLDLIDRLVALEVYGIEKELQEYER